MFIHVSAGVAGSHDKVAGSHDKLMEGVVPITI